MTDQQNENEREAQGKAQPPADTETAAHRNTSSAKHEVIADVAGSSVHTPLGNMTLSMFAKGQFVRVRVGAAHNATELYEHAYASADEANTALLEAGILTEDQVPDPLQVVGTGIQLNDVTAEQLEHAGLKKHLSSSL